MNDENHAIEIIQEQINKLRDEVRHPLDRAFSWLTADSSSADLSKAIDLP